jgi:hypothetical protein
METKHWYQSKTVWINLAIALLVIISSELGLPIESGDQTVLVLVNAINIVLRFVTSQPVGK